MWARELGDWKAEDLGAWGLGGWYSLEMLPPKSKLEKINALTLLVIHSSSGKR